MILARSLQEQGYLLGQGSPELVKTGVVEHWSSTEESGRPWRRGELVTDGAGAAPGGVRGRGAAEPHGWERSTGVSEKLEAALLCV